MSAKIEEVRFTVSPAITLQNTVDGSIKLEGSYVAVPLPNQDTRAYKVFEVDEDGARGAEKGNVFITIMSNGEAKIAVIG